ncbi:MAG: hypothetical protein NTW28_06140 [Candidatus Solibacter sp.]|nr:hypothetical protein [Candidatus Solibacter sp.]
MLVFFRAADLPQSIQVPGQMFGGSGGRVRLEPWYFGLAALAWVLAVGEEKREWFERAIRAPMPIYASALAVMLFCLETSSSGRCRAGSAPWKAADKPPRRLQVPMPRS